MKIAEMVKAAQVALNFLLSDSLNSEDQQPMEEVVRFLMELEEREKIIEAMRMEQLSKTQQYDAIDMAKEGVKMIAKGNDEKDHTKITMGLVIVSTHLEALREQRLKESLQSATAKANSTRAE